MRGVYAPVKVVLRLGVEPVLILILMMTSHVREFLLIQGAANRTPVVSEYFSFSFIRDQNKWGK